MRDRFKIRLSRKDLRYSNFGRRQLAHERPKDPPASDFRAKTVRPAKPRKRTGANTRTGLEKARRRCQGASEFGPFISSLAFPLIGSCDIVKARERTMPRPREISATGLTTRGHGVRAAPPTIGAGLQQVTLAANATALLGRLWAEQHWRRVGQFSGAALKFRRSPPA